MGTWASHPMCEACWYEWHVKPDGTVREPVRLVGAQRTTCCWCSHPTWAGIYLRAKAPSCACTKEA